MMCLRSACVLILWQPAKAATDCPRLVGDKGRGLRCGCHNLWHRVRHGLDLLVFLHYRASVKSGIGLLAVLMMPTAAMAAGNVVMDLEVQLKDAEAKLEQVQARIEQAKGRNKAADAQLQQSVRALVRVGQYPQGFWLARSVMMDTPMQAELIRVMGQQQAQALVQAQTEAKALSRLYGEANAQLQAVRDVQVAYSDARGQLHAAEQAVLRRAGIQAGQLSSDLEDALANPQALAKDTVRLPVGGSNEVAGGLPVAGRVEKAFGAGRGGVVLRAVAGAPVHATQAARVLYAGPFKHFGGLVIVKTVRGEDVLLGGMDMLNVNAGEDVAPGQQLGTAGEEGRIYWEVRRRGRVVNPL